jgi:O-antigen ligase
MNQNVSFRWPGGMNTLEITLMLAVVTMPLNYLWNSYAIALFAAAALLSTSPVKKIDRLRKQPFYWILPLTYFVWMLGTFIRDGVNLLSPDVIMYLEGSVSWFVFPILFATTEKIKGQSIQKLLLAFVVSNLCASFYCFWKAYQEYKLTNYINVFFYHHISSHIGISAIYFSMYCVFCIYILFYYFLFKKQKFWTRLICLATTVYLTFFVVILSSKTMIFLLYISALVFTVYSFYYFKSKWGALILSLLLLTIPMLLVKFPYVNARVRSTQIKEYNGSADDQNGLAVRGVLWESSWELIQARPVLGWGHSWGQLSLQEKYLQMGFREGSKNNYNSHNQYLYSWLCYGLVGLTILLIYFGSLLTSFIENRNFPGVCLLFLFILANLTECMLEAQKGIVFFFLFANLLLYHSRKRVSARAGTEPVFLS